MIIKMFPFACGMIGCVQRQLSRFSLMTNRFGGEIYNLSRCSGSNCSPPRRKSSAGMQTADRAEPKPQEQADELVFTSIRLAANTSQCSHRHVGADRIFLFLFFFEISHTHETLLYMWLSAVFTAGYCAWQVSTPASDNGKRTRVGSHRAFVLDRRRSTSRAVRLRSGSELHLWLHFTGVLNTYLW